MTRDRGGFGAVDPRNLLEMLPKVERQASEILGTAQRSSDVKRHRRLQRLRRQSQAVLRGEVVVGPAVASQGIEPPR